MRKSRQTKKHLKNIGGLLNKTLAKVIAAVIAVVLLVFSLLLTVAKGQDLYSGGEPDVEFDAITQRKNNLRKINGAKSDNFPIQNNSSAAGGLFAPSVGDVDPSFNPSFATYVGSFRMSVLQADGKLLVGGFFISINGIAKYNLARFNVDGSLDASFSPRVSDGVYSVVLQPDGKILIGGTFTFVNGVSRNRIARLNSDGSLDTTFNPGGGTDNAVYDTALQSDGKIVVGGFFTTFNGNARNHLVRLNSDGSFDSSFAANLDSNGFVFNLTALSDGKILAGGIITISGSISSLVRLNANGSSDSSFTVFALGTVREVALQPDGKILIGGSFSQTNRVRIARLNTDGTIDASFITGAGASSTVWAITPLASGKILIGGEFTTYNGVSRNRIAQLNADGSLDTAFNPGTGFSSGAVYAIKILPSGQLGVGGSFIQYNGINRDIGVLLNPDGSLDLSFSLATLFQAKIRAVITQFDGKIVVGGTFNRINGQVRSNIARLNADGTLDTSFNIGTGANGQVYAMALQNDGKILIGGSFTIYSGISRNRIARLNADGTLDTSFNSGTVDGGVYRVAIQPDGKILIGGNFFLVGNSELTGFTRLNTDGSVDTSFSAARISDPFFIEGVGIQSDGKIIIGGFSVNTGQSLLRLNSNGSLDATFAPLIAPDTNIYSLAIQDDGKILIGGTFSSIGGINQKNIARLNSNGSLDTSFNVGTGTSEGDDVEDIVVLPNGKIIIGGLINSVNGVALSNIARLNTNGSVDTTFSATADNIVWDIEIPLETIYGQGRKLYIGGDFLRVGGVSRSGLASLFIESSFNRTRFDFDGDGKSDISVFRPSNGAWYLLQSANGFTGVTFGLGTDKLVPADYDGDGKTDVAVYRNGTWYLQRSQLGFTGEAFGDSNDVPVPADYDGDGKADLAVFRPSNGTWYLLRSNLGFTGIQFGQNGDKPVPADYDGDGKADVAVNRNGTWYLLRSQLGFTGIAFGDGNDKLVPADYDGDGKADIAVFRPSNGTWYLQQSTAGFSGIAFGLGTDLPVPADYDGDGKADLAVFRNGIWYLQKSSQGFMGVAFGAADDKPIPNAFVR